MKKKMSIFLVLVIISTLLSNLLNHSNRVYAYTTTPQIISGFNYAHVLKSDGTVYGWGDNQGSLASSPLGIGYNSSYEATIKQINISNIKNIVTANGASFALLDNGSVLTWGANNMSQIGLGGKAGVGVTNKAGYVVPTLHPYLSNVNRIITSKDSYHVFAITNDGTAIMWGYNSYGQLGTGDTTTIYEPTFAGFTDVKDIALGSNHTLLLNNSGLLYAAGANGSGQLGINSTTTKTSYVLVSALSGVSKIFAGQNKSYAVKSDGSFYAWGINSKGELGVGSTGSKKVPTLVSGITDPSQVAIGSTHVIILMPDGTVKTAGDNTYGQLGYTGGNASTFNTIPGISSAVQVQAGNYHSMVLLADGTIKVFGRNDFGQLGLGYADSDVHSSPTTIPLLSLAADITPPVITIGSYNTNPTNQNITVTASTNEGVLNATSHTFTENGSFEFVATDTAGNVTKKTVTITNIDKVAPIITIDPYNTNLTNKDVVVTASTNEGSLNATLHTFTENGSFEFVATDQAGNVTTKTVTINNIDKTTPIITVGNYNTTPTNQDITVTASVDKGTLNVTSHTFTENGSFEFIATDNFGNIITKIVTITNIDKNNPSKPAISVTDNKLTILNGTDSESGVKATLYQLNNGNWAVYSDVVMLADGAYVIKAKTVDNAGNESSIEIYNANVSNNAVDAAIDALVKAENTRLQADLNTAKTLINALPDSPVKTDLINRANNLQKLIYDNIPIIIATDKDEIPREQMVNLAIKGSDLEDLYTMQLEIQYDPKKLELDHTNISNLAWDNQNGYAAIKIDSSNGVINIIYSRKGYAQGVSGDINLMSLPFKTLQIGKTSIELSNIKLVNSQGIMIKESTTSITKEIDIIPNPLNITLTGDQGQQDWYISPVTVEVHDLDAKKIYYSMDGVKDSYTQPFLISEIGEHSLTVTTDDGNGYIKEKEQVIKIDYKSPTIEVNNQNFDWQNEVKVMPKFDDQGGSGISKAWYQWTNTDEQPTQWEEYNQGELIQAMEGNWYLHIKAIDAAGNFSQTVFGPYKIEKTVPGISVDIDKRETWGSADVSVTPTFTDEGGSQLKFVGYNWSLRKSVPLEYTQYTSGSIQQSDDGAWYLHLIAEDWAGNVKTVTYGPYIIDKAAPTIEFSDVMDGTDYTDSITPIIHIDDTASGIKTSFLQLDGKDYVSGTPITERGAHTITAYAEDFTGKTATKSISFLIYTSTTLTLDVTPVEHSDLYRISATLTASSRATSGSAVSVSGSAIAVTGAAISVSVNGTDMGTYYTDSQGNIILNDNTSFKVGSNTVVATYLPKDSDYFRSSKSQSSYTVQTAKNGLNYRGNYEVLYPGVFSVLKSVKYENDRNPVGLSPGGLRAE